MLTLLATVATVSGICSGLLPLVQASTIVRGRSSVGVSLAYVAGGLGNAAVWLVYAVALHNLALIVANALWLVTGSTMLAAAARFRRRTPAAPRPELPAFVLADPDEAETLILRPVVAA